MRYEIQTYTICDGWVNTWGIEQDNGESKPEYFDSYEDAIDALDDFFDEVHEAYQQGWIKTKYRPEEYRIAEVV